MNDGEPIAQALRKLDWIAKLSKETLPGGVPADREGMRMLPNRIVLDVRAACEMLEGVHSEVPSDVSDRSGPDPHAGGSARSLHPRPAEQTGCRSYTFTELPWSADWRAASRILMDSRTPAGSTGTGPLPSRWSATLS